jgi:glycosyltransferase involved in cell wall biosynthesis
VRILYHHRTRAEDAQGIHIQEIVRAFRGLGHEVRVAALARPPSAAASPKSRRPRVDLLAVLPAPIYELMSLAYNLHGYRMLLHEAHAFRPDLLYERYSLNTFCGIWAARRLNVPMLLEVNAPLAYEQEKLGRLSFRALARRSERWICSNSTRTIVVTGVMKALLTASGVPSDHMVVMPNGVDTERFRPHVPADAVVRRYRLEGRIVVGFVGWFRPWHGLEMLLEVFNGGRFAEMGTRLLLVGDGPARPALERLIAQHDLTRAVVLTGPVAHEEIPAHIAAMDVAVQPRAPDYACPMKIIEYMAMAKCIVAPDQANIREIVTDGENGLLFAPGDASALRRALLRVTGDPAQRVALGQKALETISSRGLLWTKNAERALELARTSAIRPSHR